MVKFGTRMTMGRPMKLQFPLLGLNLGRATGDQPYATSFSMNNVRLYDTQDKRARGGQRPGLVAWGNEDLIGGSNQPVVAMCVVSSIL